MSHCSHSPSIDPLQSQAGIYLHTPFCWRKCSYCTFYSKPPNPGEVTRYIAAARRELRQSADLPAVQELRFQSVFFGGGTPSVLGLEVLCQLLDDCLQLFPFAVEEEPELSVEVHPGGLTAAQDFQELRRMGFNRISIGVQSFADEELRRIGRTHDVATARAAIQHARQAGFTNLNMDLMYGLPKQTWQEWSRNLYEALILSPEHFSAYELSLTRGIPRHEQMKADLPHEDEILAMMDITEKMTEASLLEPYEISNYAIPGHKCRHNLNYWRNGFWLGIGPCASSSFDNKKMETKADTAAYLAHLEAGAEPERVVDELDLDTAFKETVITALRLREGVSRTALQERFGLDLREYYGDLLDKMVTAGLLVWQDNFLALTSEGRALSNQVLKNLV